MNNLDYISNDKFMYARCIWVYECVGIRILIYYYFFYNFCLFDIGPALSSNNK